jgi:hypothetical protein
MFLHSLMDKSKFTPFSQYVEVASYERLNITITMVHFRIETLNTSLSLEMTKFNSL